MLRLDLGENLDGELQHVIANSAREINSEVLIINERWEHANRDDNYDYYTDMADGVMNYPGLDAIIIWFDAISNAVGNKLRPITAIIAPVTCGGKYFFILSTPTNFITKDNIT